ncbi:MAG: hypothetical protein DRR42_20075 [Gammaproteobacteria bacterium]|nr:MAG: hypothetical protein DRR42_20075 [Gammaproteobacteria bacterium]
MTESTAHRRAKGQAAGRSGTTEKKISGGRRLDAVTRKTATEIERSGSSAGLVKAARRLRDSGKPKRVLQVPQTDMAKAADAMRKVGIGGTVKNMSGTKRQSISKPSKRL